MVQERKPISGIGSVEWAKTDPTNAITPADVPPVNMTALVDCATACSPRVNACSSRCESLREVAPPVIEMSTDGRRIFQYLAIKRATRMPVLEDEIRK